MNRLLALLLLAMPSWAQLAPKFDIIRATYGAGSTQADVTERVRSKIVNGGLNIQVNADTLGIDPVPNTRKTLTVEYWQGFTRRTTQADDFNTLRIGNAPVQSLRITKAQYGDGRRMKDVTEILNGRITASRLELVISNANLGGDPAPAVKKAIIVEYEFNGRAATAKLAEGETLRLPDGAAPASLAIVKALYTGGRRTAADVTGAVAALIAGDTLELTVNGATLGADPAPGVVKTLSVEYDYNGQRQLVTARDGEVLRINKTVPAATFRVLSATYSGGRRLTADVTGAVTARATAAGVELVVNADTLGVDPAPGTVKTLTVEYELNGRRLTATARDAETLRLPNASGAAQKGPVVMAGDVGNVRAACLYRQPNYTGEAVCFSASQAQSAISNVQSGFRSMKLNGVAAVDLYEQTNFSGRSQAITADVPDLLLLPGSWWRYESAAPIQSARAR